jgi:hypothetical protein
MDPKELKEAIFDMFRKSKETPKPQYKRIDSMLGGKMNLTADDFAQLDPNSDPEKLKAAFEDAYLRGNTDSRASLKTLLDTAPYNEMKDMVAQIDAARGTANTNPNRQFGASNQPTVNRSGGGLFEEQYIYKQNTMTQEQLRMQMLAGIITEGQYKEKMEEVDSMDKMGNSSQAPGNTKVTLASERRKDFEDAIFKRFKELKDEDGPEGAVYDIPYATRDILANILIGRNPNEYWDGEDEWEEALTDKGIDLGEFKNYADVLEKEISRGNTNNPKIQKIQSWVKASFD